jgi:hypothetical protein
LAHVVDEREERLRIRRELVGLLARRVGDVIQDPLGFVQLSSARGRHSCEAVGIVVIHQEQRPDPWITDRQRGREGQDAVADVLLTSAAERFETALVAACGFWLVSTLSRQLANALEADRTWGIATVRQRLLARLEAFIITAEEFGQMTALRGMTSQLLELLHKAWPDVPPLPLYPAFQRTQELGQ